MRDIIVKSGNNKNWKKITIKKTFFQRVKIFLVPSFLIGYPNLFDNLKILRKHSQFKPLRLAFSAWLIFTFVVGSAGIYSLINLPKAQATNPFSIKTGYYYGNGATLSVSGVGFQPDVLLIKSDTAAGQLVWKSSVMPDTNVAYLGVATSNNVETEIIIDSDGFTVSPALEVNTKNTRYTYVAFQGSDCSSVDSGMCVGFFTGDGTAQQVISTGFQPDLVWVKRANAVAGNFTTSALAGVNPTYAAFFSAVVNDTLGTGLYYKSLDANGFTVGLTNNVLGAIHYYVAFKNTTGKLTVGSFTGNGVDDRNISGIGFEPDFVFVKQNAAIGPAFNTTECWGDYSLATLAGAGALNHIQSLDVDGFQVGNSTAVNTGGVLSYWFAFGGAPDPAPTENFLMETGHYVGDGQATHIISTLFAPDLVFIKADDSAQYAMWSTRRDTDITHYFATPTASIASGIKSMEDASFTLGNNATVNTNLINYEYVAFGNATTPQTGAHAADLVIGSYSGNGLTPTTAPRVIDHLGITPDMVVVKPSVVAAASNINYWKSSSMTGANETAYFTATANDTTGTLIRSLDGANGGGFTMGSNVNVNTAAVVYVFFAFKEGAGTFDVGTYNGNSVVDTEITGLGFQPDYVWTKRNTNTSAAHRSSSDGITGDFSQYFLPAINAINMITGFLADGFKVGTSAYVNTSTVPPAYHYAAWKATNVSNPPDIPTNSSPTNLAIDQNLNTTLVSSVYNDQDSDPQTNTQWQVDDDSDFLSPVWRRTAGGAEETTSIAFANGTFANELDGKTELDHNSTYYWRVKYSDGVWSDWSTATSFTTNTFSTPTNSSPANEATVTTLTPTLTASAFSDAQGSHTASSAQWQISTSDSFSSPIYDSGTVAYGTSYAVPGATLSDQSTYYWQVRHKDSGGQWSSYSTATRFLVSKSEVSVGPLFGSTVIDQGDEINIDAQIKLADGTVINDATVNINIYNPSGTKIVNTQPMVYITDSNGIYRYASYVVPAVSGSYLYEVTAVSNSVTGYGAANFEVRTIQADVTDIALELASHEAAEAAERVVQDAERVSQAAERVNQAAERINQDASRIKVNDIQTKVTDVQGNLDVLIGAFIVTQSTVNDASPTATLFISALTNSVDDFYKNAVLTFTSGNLDGQVRRISAYNGTTKTITLDPALTSAPANGDVFTITKQNVRVEEQVAEVKTVVDNTNTKVSDIQTKVNDIQGKVNAIQTDLGTINTNLGNLQSTVNSLRASQQAMYTLRISDVSEMQPESNYRSTLMVRDYEGNPIDLVVLPKIIIYDSLRAEALAETDMTKVTGITGVYEYIYAIPGGVTAGLWETVVKVDTGGTEENYLNDYWQVTGSPAQVLVNSVSASGLNNVLADVTITNEGSSEYEYHYEYCIVDNSDNACGGNDDIFHGTGSKLIGAGIDYNTKIPVPPAIPMSVPIAGTYYFKLIVYYGTEASGASLQFTATEQTIPPIVSLGGSSGGSQVITLETLYNEMQAMRQELQVESKKITKTLSLVGNVDPNSLGFKSLLDINTANTEDLKGIQNRISDLRAVSSVAQKLIEQNGSAPIVETYMKFNSVEINFLITNPLKEAQTVKFSAFLPEEARPENIMNSSGLKVEYDPSAKTYFVSGDISLGPRQTVTKKVEMKDIWVFDEVELNSIKQQAIDIVKTLEKTQFESQGIILKGDIESTVNMVITKQKASYSSPQDHIVTYRENKDRVAKIQDEFNQLKNLVAQSNSSKGIIGNIGGIQTFATWGIILAIIFGFGLLAAVIFAMWRHQTMLAATEMRMNRRELDLLEEKKNNENRRI